MVTRWSALTAAVALFVGLGLVGDTPDTRDSTGQVAGYFVSHSASVLAGAAKPPFELTLAASGFFSPDVQQQAVFQGFLLWLVMVAFTRTREPSALPRPRPLVDSAR